MEKAATGLSWPGSLLITAEPDATEADRSVLGSGWRPCSSPKARSPHSERMYMCLCGVHLRGSCIVYSENTTDLKVGVKSRDVRARGVKGVVIVFHISGGEEKKKKKKKKVCLRRRRRDPSRPTGVRPSCQQTWGGDHSLRFYFCRLHVIIKQLST